MERTFMMNKTMSAADKLITKRERDVTTYGITSTNYINPETITKNINFKLRSEKEDEMVLWDQLVSKARHEFPSATVNKLHAIVFKQIQEIKSGKGKNDHDPELTLKPDISRSAASKPPAPVKPKRRI
jgi:hypothetical protein